MSVYMILHRWSCGNYGWDEKWYVDTGGPADARSLCNAMSATRLAMCGGLPSIEIWQKQVRNVDDKDDVFIDNLPETNQKSVWFEEDIDRPWTGALYFLQSQFGTRRTFLARGIADSVTSANWDLPILDPKFVLASNAFRNLLKNGRWRIRTIALVPQPLQPIESMSVVAPHGWVTVTSTAHGLATGGLIRWHRVQATPACFTGQVRVTRLTDDTFQVRNTNIKTLVFTKGQFRKVVYSYDNITVVDQDRVGEHPTGPSKVATKGKTAPCRR